MIDKDWHLLLTLYEEGSITRAAEKLYISQPALTYRIKQLEKEFQAKILLRNSKGVTFTNEGEHLVNYSREMVKQLQQTKDHIINMQDKIQGTLRIGVSSNFALYQLPSLLEGFLEKYPNVEITLKTGWSSDVIHMLQSDQVHVAVARGEIEWKGQSLPLIEEPICIASKEKLSIQDLPNLNQIKYQTDIHLKDTFDQWWQSTFELPPKILMEVDRLETCKELVKKGLGYGIFPSISLQNETAIYTLPIENNEGPIKRKTSALYRETSLELNVVRALIDYLRVFYV